jgi:hypothetical protein
MVLLGNQNKNLEAFFLNSVNQLDQYCILTAVESSFQHHFLKQRIIQIWKFSALRSYYQKAAHPTQTNSGSKKSVLNLLQHVLTEAEEAVLQKGFDFAVTSSVFNLHMACVVESVSSEHPPVMGTEFSWNI